MSAEFGRSVGSRLIGSAMAGKCLWSAPGRGSSSFTIAHNQTLLSYYDIDVHMETL
jgi:hypothetical protein